VGADRRRRGPRARSLLRDCRRLAGADAELHGAAGQWLERLA
jgi:chemotaxis protein methyltransferase CheR